MIQFRRFLRAIRSIYAPDYLPSLIWLLADSNYNIWRFLKRFWTTQSFADIADKRPSFNTRNRALYVFVSLGSVLQILLAISLLAAGVVRDVAGVTPVGLALIVAHPIVWAHLLAIGYGLFQLSWYVRQPKRAGRAVVCVVLEWQVKRLRKRHKFTIVAVAGSIGKTSTKLAIAHTLEASRRVMYQTGNYNDRVTVPLVLFGQKLPNLFNVPAWLRIWLANERTIRLPKYYDMAVLELGADHPGDLKHFAYLRPEIGVVTAVTPEHMAYFKTLDAVAAEELSIFRFATQGLINADDTAVEYRKDLTALTYGTTGKTDFAAHDYKPAGLHGGNVTLHLQQGVTIDGHAAILGQQGVKILLAAAAAAQLAGLSEKELVKGLRQVKPFAGRMQILPGILNSTLIDDTYNATPIAVKAALDVLYAAPATQRIAILGSMNELGDYSRAAHLEVAKHCNPEKLDFIATIGADAKKYLAPVAAKAGCKVHSFDSPYEAGDFVRNHLKKGAVVLAKGSQNRVFAEESLKVLLAHSSDAKKLVRQSVGWLKDKQVQFGTQD